MDDRSKPAETKDPRVEAAIRDYLERVDRGEPVNREEFISRHGEIADALRSFFAAEEPLRKMAVTKISEQSAGISTRSIAAQGQETVPPKPNADRPLGTIGSGLQGQVGRYQIIRALGNGAMGTVYLAEDTRIERLVALKTPHFTEDPSGELLERFYREARMAATLRHSHICPIHDVGQIDGRHFISMAYIEGRPLSASIQPDKPQTERQILSVIRKLALALQAAHDKGIVHRDLKPANIMVDKRNEPIIMDFGLARQARPDGDARLTQTGNILGTPAFMSPEQVEGKPDKIGPPSDQYSLGVILYELLTGQLPFRGSLVVVMRQVLTKEPRPPSQLRPELDPRIEAVCLKMMAKIPSQRFASMQAVADELAAILRSPAAEAISKRQRKSSPPPSSVGDRMPPDGGAFDGLNSLRQQAVTEGDLERLEKKVRKCYARRDFEQAIQIIERIPEDRRSDALQTLLEKAREKADEISFLICEIDEADRLKDARTALKKAEELLKLKPGHHRARAIQEKYSGYGEGGEARIGPLHQFAQPWNKGGRIPWRALAFGLAVFGGVPAVIVLYFGRGAVVTDVTESRGAVATDVQQTRGAVVTAVQVTGAATVKPHSPQLLVVPFDQAKAGQETCAADLKISAEFTNSIGMQLRLIPPGEFLMGSTKDQIKKVLSWGTTDRMFKREQPTRRVLVVRPFYLGIHEVTRGEFATFVAATGYKTETERDGRPPEQEFTTAKGENVNWRNPGYPQTDRHPVVDVTQADAVAFCEWLSLKEGRTYRLPNEAEWEHACRAGTSTLFYTGDDPQNAAQSANMADNGDGYEFTAPVGSFPPNPFGLYDMSGNVWEFCQDAGTPDSGARGAERDPSGSANDSIVVACGGAADCPPYYCRSAMRNVEPRSTRSNSHGFRVACEIVATAAP